MLRTIANAGVLACGAALAGCAADTTPLDTSDHCAASAAQVDVAGTAPVEMKAVAESMEGLEPTAEAQEALTRWQQLCIIGCAAFANGGCAAVSVSCTAGALWSFGGILIPCSYAVVAACTGAGVAGAVCSIKCSGG